MIALLLLVAQFYCPAHPDRRADTAGPCGVCAQRMVRMPPARFETHPVDLRVTATTSGARLRLAVLDPRTRATVRRFVRPVQLFIVGASLEFFASETPVPQSDGVFMIDVALPRPGAYMAIAAFLPEGMTPQTFQQMFTTGEPFAAPATPAVDVAEKTMDGVRVSLDASQLKAGEPRPMAVRFEGAAVDPSGGAVVRLLVVSTDLTEAIIERRDVPSRDAVVTFTPLVPRAGRYKAWVQIPRTGGASAASFVFDVP